MARLRRHRHVGRGNEAEAAGPRVAVDADDDRHRALDHGREDGRHAAGCGRAALGQVGARTEHRARSRQHDRPHVGVSGRVTQRLFQLRQQAAAESALRLAGESSVRVRTPSRCCTPTNTSVTDAQCRGDARTTGEKGRWYRAPVIESDEHQLFRKTLRDLFEREIEPHVDEWEAARIFPAHELFPKLARRRPVRPRVRRGRRRHGGRPHLLADRRRGDGPDQLRRRPDGHGGADVDGDAGAGPLRVARAEGAVPGAGHPRRGRDLHRGDRARRWQRRRRHPHPRRARRGRVGHQRRQALHHERHAGRLALPAGPHLRRSGLPRHVAHCGADGHRRAWSSRASSRSWACGRATPRSCRSATCGCRWPTPSAKSGGASNSRWCSSRPSGS